MKKPSIPPLPPLGAALNRFCAAIQERMEIIGGERNSRIQPIADPATASVEDVARKLNEILEVLQ